MSIKHRTPEANSDIQARLGDVVRTERRRLNITQEELAWRADMHRTYIADIERGARNITLRSIVHLAKALQVTVGHLLTYATPPGERGAEGGGAGGGPEEAQEILLVEDEPLDAELTVCAFKQARVTNPLKVARTGEQALEYLQGSAKRAGQRPRLILLDLKLPGMSGLALLRRIKADRRLRDIPIVALTGSCNDRFIIECARLGAQNYIVKPLDVESVVRLAPRLKLDLTLGVPHPPEPYAPPSARPDRRR